MSRTTASRPPFLCQAIPLESERLFILVRGAESEKGGVMLFYGFYVVALVVLILHFTGWLKRNNLEWLVLVLAVATFPVVIFLR